MKRTDARDSGSLKGAYHERLRSIFGGLAVHYRETEGCLYGAFDAYRITLERLYPLSPSRRRVVREELSFAHRGIANHFPHPKKELAS